jgi:hypothetical protein
MLTPLIVGTAQAQSSVPKHVDARLTIRVLDIDLTKKIASVTITVTIINYPTNDTSLLVRVIGGGDVAINCTNISQQTYNSWWFQGRINETAWFLGGYGETFPFDSYGLYFSIPYDNFEKINCTVTPNWSEAFFDGPKVGQLRDQWFENSSYLIPVNWYPVTQHSSLDYNENSTNWQMGVSIQRSSNASNTAILEFIAPIIGCYYVLVASLLLTLNDLTERLTIYLAIFVFVPAFFIGIQTYLPYRASLSFPELLLANLVISTTILTVFSIIGRHGWSPIRVKFLQKLKIHHNNWDLLAIFFCISLFLLTYCLTLIDKISPEASFIVLYLIIPAYLLWYPIQNIREINLKSTSFKQSILSLIVGGLVLTIIFLVTNNSILYSFFLIYAFMAGFIVSLYLKKMAKSTVVGLFVGLLSTMLTGIGAGILYPIPDRSFIISIWEGIARVANMGYLIGVYSAFGGLAGALLLFTHAERRKKINLQEAENSSLLITQDIDS